MNDVTSLAARRFNQREFARDCSFRELLEAMIERAKDGDIEHMVICFSYKDKPEAETAHTAYKQAGDFTNYETAGLLEVVKLMMLGR